MADYLVSARKYRPLLFQQVVGQEHITNTLKNAIETGRIAHSYLLTGPRGVGKTTTARIFSKALNCDEGPTVSPCNKCDSCLSVNDGTSIDVLEIDGASNRGIDEIRSLKENVNYTASVGKYKIYIIDEVHMLTEAAFNALLKTLEEPPPKVVFIFATTEPHKIPITILSRCQRYDFKKISIERVVHQLSQIKEREKIEITQSALRLIARKGEGSMRDSESIFDQVVSFCGTNVKDDEVEKLLGITGYAVFHELFTYIVEENVYEGLKKINEILFGGVDVNELLKGLSGFLRDLTIVKLNAQPDSVFGISDDQLEQLKDISSHYSLLDLFRMNSILGRYEKKIKFSMDGAVQLEMLFIKLATMNQLKEIEPIISKLKKHYPAETVKKKRVIESPAPDKEKNHEERWRDFLDKVYSVDPVLHMRIKEGEWVGVENGVVKIKISYIHERTKKQLMEKKNAELLNSLLKEFYGENAKLDIDYEIVDKKIMEEKLKSGLPEVPFKEKTFSDYFSDYPVIQYLVTKFEAKPIEKKQKKEWKR